jgi:polysaccharide pyruvyl transferase WcaK-like protein
MLAPYPVTEHLCDEPYVSATLDRLTSATPEDLIVIGGGGLFMDYFEPFWKGFLPIAKRVPFVIWGTGYCDMKRKPSRPPDSLLEEIVGQSRYCFVRDELTRMYLANCHIPREVPCPSIAVIEAPSSRGHGLLYADAYDNIGQNVHENTVTILKEFADRTGRSYHQTCNVIEKGNERQLMTMLDAYAHADVIVASRLHGCIIGVAMGRNILAISGDRKIESFMRSAGLSDWVLDLDEIEILQERLDGIAFQVPWKDFTIDARQRNRDIAVLVKRLAGEAAAR